MNKFKPQLAPNDLLSVEAANQLSEDEYFLQYKVDGLRGVVREGDIRTRSMKKFPNRALDERMEDLRISSYESNYHIDGEFDSESIPFNELSGILRSFDKPLPDDLVFKIFDIFDPLQPSLPALHRWRKANRLQIKNCEIMINLPWPADFAEAFKSALDAGYEGLMVKRKDAPYKLGRGTYKQGIVFKMKPYETFDEKIISLVQATIVRDTALRTINELGRSVTSKKKGDRVLTESCSSVWVSHNGKELKVSLAPFSHKKREEVWNNPDEWIGKYIEYKGMMVGAKDLPRHAMIVRKREDKDV
jgi:ATP-dependent DNA ligase